MTINFIGTRDEKTMKAYVAWAHGGELRGVLAEAEREGDRELATLIRAELEHRGL